VDDALLLWDYEQRLWADAANFCREHLSPNALLTLSGRTFDRAAGAEALRNTPRWSSLTFFAQRALRASAGTAVIAYVAEVNVEGAETAYTAHCSSTYVHVRGSWLLVAHQRDDLKLWTEQRAQLEALSLFLTTADERPRRVLHQASG